MLQSAFNAVCRSCMVAIGQSRRHRKAWKDEHHEHEDNVDRCRTCSGARYRRCRCAILLGISASVAADTVWASSSWASSRCARADQGRDERRPHQPQVRQPARDEDQGDESRAACRAAGPLRRHAGRLWSRGLRTGQYRTGQLPAALAATAPAAIRTRLDADDAEAARWTRWRIAHFAPP